MGLSVGVAGCLTDDEDVEEAVNAYDTVLTYLEDESTNLKPASTTSRRMNTPTPQLRSESLRQISTGPTTLGRISVKRLLN